MSDPELVDSVLATKINAYLGGYSEFCELNDLAKKNNLNETFVKTLKEIAKAGGDPRSCH